MHEKIFDAVLARARKEISPKITVGPKKAFALHTLINWILNLVYSKEKQDSYYKSFTTTIGYSIAIRAGAETADGKFTCWDVLAHEIYHVVQAMKWTRPLFFYLYLWPISQGIALLLGGWVGVFWVPGWWKLVYLGAWLVATGVHFIPQWPDPWRKRWELQAYTVSMHIHFLVHGHIKKEYIEDRAENFHSMAYFIMEPNKKKICAELEQITERIKSGDSPVKDLAIVKIVEEEYKRLAA